jgi:hypothetical protein
MIRPTLYKHTYIALKASSFAIHRRYERTRELKLKDEILKDIYSNTLIASTLVRLKIEYPDSLITVKDIMNIRARAARKA